VTSITFLKIHSQIKPPSANHLHFQWSFHLELHFGGSLGFLKTFWSIQAKHTVWFDPCIGSSHWHLSQQIGIHQTTSNQLATNPPVTKNLTVEISQMRRRCFSTMHLVERRCQSMIVGRWGIGQCQWRLYVQWIIVALILIPNTFSCIKWHCCQKRALNEGFGYLTLIVRSKWQESELALSARFGRTFRLNAHSALKLDSERDPTDTLFEWSMAIHSIALLTMASLI
jgi:hypothetical protein